MDQREPTHSLKATSSDYELGSLTAHPAHLWIGDETTSVAKLEALLKQLFCEKNGCNGTCADCKQINSKQHSQFLWLFSEKSYTIDLLDPLFKAASFALAPSEQFFFVLQRADFLNQTCANALLKLLEEPPRGYHFILLAERQDYILPTIRSRCLVKQIQAIIQRDQHQFTTWFANLNSPDPATFLRTLETATPSEQETLAILDALLVHWSQYSRTTTTPTDTSAQMLVIIKKALESTPMPGSAKLFWKDFYLKVSLIT